MSNNFHPPIYDRDPTLNPVKQAGIDYEQAKTAHESSRIGMVVFGGGLALSLAGLLYAGSHLNLERDFSISLSPKRSPAALQTSLALGAVYLAGRNFHRSIMRYGDSEREMEYALDRSLRLTDPVEVDPHGFHKENGTLSVEPWMKTALPPVTAEQLTFNVQKLGSPQQKQAISILVSPPEKSK